MQAESRGSMQVQTALHALLVRVQGDLLCISPVRIQNGWSIGNSQGQTQVEGIGMVVP